MLMFPSDFRTEASEHNSGLLYFLIILETYFKYFNIICLSLFIKNQS